MFVATHERGHRVGVGHAGERRGCVRGAEARAAFHRPDLSAGGGAERREHDEIVDAVAVDIAHDDLGKRRLELRISVGPIARRERGAGVRELRQDERAVDIFGGDESDVLRILHVRRDEARARVEPRRFEPERGRGAGRTLRAQ